MFPEQAESFLWHSTSKGDVNLQIVRIILVAEISVHVFLVKIDKYGIFKTALKFPNTKITLKI